MSTSPDKSSANKAAAPKHCAPFWHAFGIISQQAASRSVPFNSALGQFVKLSCILKKEEFRPNFSDLVLFPEYVEKNEIESLSRESPGSVIAGAYEKGGFSIGIICHCGRPVMEYRKVDNDGRTKGSDDPTQHTIYETESTCFGMLVCMDVNNVQLRQKTIGAVKSSGKSRKIILVPGDMGAYWFSGDFVNSIFQGVNVVLCNHTKTHQSRCQSFITYESGQKFVIQVGAKPIYAELP